MKFSSIPLIAVAGATLIFSANGAVIAPTAWKQSNAFSTNRLASNLSNATGMNGDQTILYNHDGSLLGEPTTVDGSAWSTSAKANPNTQPGRNTAMADGKVWIVADLGASYDLTTIRIWNFNWDNTPGTPLTSLNDRGVSQFDIFVRNTAADTDDGTVGGAAINLTSVSDATNALTNAAVFNLGSSDPWTLAISNQALGQAPNNDTYTGESFDLTGQTARFVAIRVDSSYGGAGISLGKVRIEAVPEPRAALLGGLGLLALLRRRR